MKKLKVGDSIDPEKLLGAEMSLMLYVDDVNCFRLGQVVFEVLEDENDGYRSSMKDLIVRDISPKKATTKLDTVSLIKENNTVYQLQSTTDGFCWLRFGTDNADDYYPSFVFDWTPRLSESDKELLKLVK